MSGTFRKIVQLAGAASDTNPAGLYALCNDGTLWERIYTEDCSWRWVCVDTNAITTSNEVQS